MQKKELAEGAASGTMPDLKGWGLKEALYAIESAGGQCTYEGTGHVVSQQPAAGSKWNKAETVKLILK